MVLVTGGAGYIGSHTTLALIEAGYEVVVYDNLSNATLEAIKRVERITSKRVHFEKGDIRDKKRMKELFCRYDIEAVLHFAGLKAVGESVQKPLEYYDNNVTGTLHLLEAMLEAGIKKIVFSSSATVYGDPARVPISEDFALSATNPYGRSKLFIEYILKDLFVSDNTWKIILLRYFNPVGAHESGLIGEDPSGIPNNLMPFIAQVAVGKREYLNIFGNDYDTPDGTGVRDYIHVMDLAYGHVKALEKLDDIDRVEAVNLGTGRGYSVLEMVEAFQKASGKEIPYRFTSRRPGDIATCYADPSYAKSLLGWEAKRDLEQMCKDHWRWQKNNPDGYKK